MALNVNESNFDKEVLEAELPVLVDFWAPWCAPCRALSPVIDELSTEFSGKVSIVKVNVDEAAAIAGKFHIRAIPTLILFKKGQVVEQLTGAMSKERLVDVLNEKALA